MQAGKKKRGRGSFLTPKNAQAHHVFPVALEPFFNKSGVKIHNPAFGAWWNATKHGKNSYAYEQAWRKFFKKFDDLNKIPTRDQIFTEGRRLGGEFGFSVFYPK